MAHTAEGYVRRLCRRLYPTVLDFSLTLTEADEEGLAQSVSLSSYYRVLNVTKCRLSSLTGSTDVFVPNV